MDVKKEIIKENQRVTVSKRMLKDALIRLLGKKPIQQINVSELCREAAVNRSTFYRLYNIPIEVMEDIIQDHITVINSMLSFSEDARLENTQMIYKYLYEHRDVFIPILHNYDYRIIMLLEKKFYQMFKKEYGLFESEEKYLFICSFLTAGGLAIARRWLETENSMSPEELSELYQEFITAQRKPRKPKLAVNQK